MVMEPSTAVSDTCAVANRIEEMMVKRDLSRAALARLLNTSPQQLGRLINEQRELTRSWLEKIAKVLDCLPSDLLPGPGSRPRTVPLVGFVGAGDLYYPDPVSGPWVGFDEVEAPPGDDNVFAVRVRGDSMAPVYRDGDTLYFQRDHRPAPSDSVGDDCIVQVRNGPAYIKIISSGSRGRFLLRSYNKDTQDIVGADIDWCAPVLWARRGKRRGK